MMRENLDICLIEDDKLDYALFKEQLSLIPASSLNYTLHHFDSYQSGLNALNNNNFDICFVDNNLHNDLGSDLIKNAANIEGTPPFVIITGKETPELHKDLTQCDVYSYILKDELSPSKIRRAITYTLEHARITHQLQTERDLIYRIIQDLPDPVIAICKGHIKFVNNTTCNITGYTSEELQGQNIRFLLPEITDDQIVQACENGNFSLISNITTKADEERPIYWRGINKNRSSNTLDDTFYISGKDLTQEEKEQELLRRKEKMVSLGFLSNGIAHEINNLLVPIQLASEMLQEDTPLEDTKELSEKIIRNTEAAARLVEDILIFSRNDKKETDPLPLDSTFKKSMASITESIPKGINIEIQGNETLKDKAGHVTHKSFERVLRHIIMNSSQSMNNKGSISLKISETDEQHLPCTLTNQAPSGKFLHIQISDQGQGIPVEFQKNIFDPFFTTHKGSSIGLGLSIVHAAVNSWDGHIDFESKENEGTRFDMWIPYIEKAN